ncbi:MAG: DUF305 domain-containing protein [Solirubrobacterales bacterium]|nr:DUF305 domain-containing protein [Solirubrobacterales bacterium]
MNRARRAGLGITLAVIVAVGLVVGGVLAAGGEESAEAQAPFMGLADPKAAYDLRFFDEMIMHHQGAIMSSAGMIADSRRPELRKLAQRIQASQTRQLKQMQTWRKQWYPRAGDSMMSMGGMPGMGEGVGSMGMMGRDAMMGGDHAERMFLRMMVPHHQLAVEMGEDALENAEHEELKGLARAIVDEQSAEIEQMEGYLKAWYGDESTRDLAAPMREMMGRMMGGMHGMGAQHGMGMPERSPGG